MVRSQRIHVQHALLEESHVPPVGTQWSPSSSLAMQTNIPLYRHCVSNINNARAVADQITQIISSAQ